MQENPGSADDALIKIGPTLWYSASDAPGMSLGRCSLALCTLLQLEPLR